MRKKTLAVFFGVCSLLAAYIVTRPADVPFQKHTIDLGSSESAAVCDINGDGHLDIVSGENWYEGPSWKKHHFRDIYYTNNYVDDLSTVPLDVNGDGHVDLVTVGWFGKKIAWWENPGRTGKPWQEHDMNTTSPVEFAELVDLDNDGKAEEVLPEFGDPKMALTWYSRDGHGGMAPHVAYAHSMGHGIGAGDVNGDGRNDILTPNGWLEAPADPKSPDWKLHEEWKLGDVGFMYVADVNNDGKPDVITSMAHNYGIFWLENKGGGTWEKHVIDDSWSQPHAVTVVNFRDGKNIGLLTGKRYMAHNGKDPGAREPLGIYWYERLISPGSKEASTGRDPAPRNERGTSADLGAGRESVVRANSSNVEWVKHVIDYGGRTGGGIQIPAVDIDGDGDLDFVVAGKSGLFLFENKTK